MTENEKLVRDETEAIECLKSNKPTSGYLMLQESIDMAIKALEEVQQYRELTDRLKAIYGDQMTLKDMVDVMERIIREPGRKDPVNARILTYDEAAMWDEYRKIGTVEECRAVIGKDAKRVIKKHKVVAPEDIEAFGADALLGRCPVCEELVNNVWNEKYCGDCGQKLDWSDNE